MTVTDHFDSHLAPVERGNAHYSIGTEFYSPRLTVVRASGDLDLGARTDLAQALDDALRGETVVLLDLSAVAFMYSGAACVIVDAAARSAGRLEIYAPTRPARLVLDALGAATIGADPRAA
ncbi:sulfate transporter [Rhodococcus sp. 05-340-1]|uniref:STAS domain-containing protein n=1 Tax=unclassified Rhodococcus (in: high G+C Gram-positive bacteria) TaxID=192944 RepID=UPI000B9B1120|nr:MULTISPECIES: STAS domain-containing protein [unclassified Rhodococcus (in: high G+C Gram-positive bacteria)]OZD61420.1 sulfate transporter [Rhodococcus sp. 05-340-2]OZD82638.1 sulfate transporter [Rhodococcus sp. 05-340-1]OZF28543.1 sulfate transporter [Rhodococcus sp. 14-2483-1-2]